MNCLKFGGPFCILPVAGVPGASLRSNFDCPRMSDGHAKCQVEHWQSPSNALAECSGKHSNAESFEFGLHCDILYITGYHRISQVSVVRSCN